MPVSSERAAFCSASQNVRPMLITSPTLFICVPSVVVGAGELLEREARPLHDDVVDDRLERGAGARNEPNQMNNVNTAVPGTNNAHSFRFLQTNVYSRPLTRISEKLNYVAQSDWGYQTRALLNDKTAHYYGLNQYLFYKVSDCWSWGLRGEWFRDEEGFRVGGFQAPRTRPL